ncbi:MAG: hypothetical protein HFJ54_03775 [Clostridia bacterium]|nr:hypothetical protein [Clostridia bacterium]
MAAKALGKEKVLAVMMPCNSVFSDFEDAKSVVDKFGVKSMTVDLLDIYKSLETSINAALEDTEISEEAGINIKPRLRMTTLYATAQTLGYLVIRHRKSFRGYGSVIQQNGEIVAMTLIH